MEINTEISQRINGRRVTHRQIEVLTAVRSEGSQTAAAKKLGISVPVVHRYIAFIEENIGSKVIRTTPKGTVLTDEGEKMIDSARMMRLRCAEKEGIAVACTPVTEELVMTALSETDPNAELMISEDSVNIRLFKEGRVDMILIDDPVHLFDLDGYVWTEIGSMDMVHVDRGPSYIEYRYGAQRIAFMHLEAIGKEYRIERRTMSMKDLMDSGKSFFIDSMLLAKEGIRIRSATDPRLLRHTVNAVTRRDADVKDILDKIVSMGNSYLNR